jgi:hypothetical protein
VTEREIRQLLRLVENRPDDLGRLTRKLIGDFLVLLAKHGEIDADGEIVDEALFKRLRGAIGEHYSVEIDPEAHARMTMDLLP